MYKFHSPKARLVHYSGPDRDDVVSREVNHLLRNSSARADSHSTVAGAINADVYTDTAAFTANPKSDVKNGK